MLFFLSIGSTFSRLHLRQRDDKIMNVCQLRCLNDVRICDGPLNAVRDVLANAHVEENRLLRDETDRASKMLQIERTNIEIVNFLSSTSVLCQSFH